MTPVARGAGEARAGSIAAVAFGVTIATFASYHQFKLPVVLPVLLERYGYDRVLAGSFVSVYAVAGLLFSLWAGRVVARRGALAPVLGALALVVLGGVVTLARPDSGALVLLGRALEGVGCAAIAVAGPALAQGNAPPRHLGLVVGLTAAWIPSGQLLAAGLAALAPITTGWTLLWVAGLGAAIAFALWGWRLEVRTGALGARPRAASAVPAPPPASAAQRRSFALVAIVFPLFAAQYFGYMTWLPQYLVDVHGAGMGVVVLGYVLPVSLVLVFNLLSGVLMRAGWRPGTLLSLAMAAQAAVWWLLPWTGAGASGLVSLVVYGAGAGIVPGCLFAMPSTILRRSDGLAHAFGLVMTGRNVGVLVGPVLLAQVFKLAGSWDLAAPVFGAITTLGLVISIVLAIRLARCG